MNFETVKRKILRDMNACKTHDAMSWARILLNNTGSLTNTAEQTKFWHWFLNPGEEDHVPPPKMATLQHTCIDQPRFVSVPLDDEKQSVQLENEYHRDGLAMYIRTRPVNAERGTSLKLQDRPRSPRVEEKTAE